MKMLAWAGLSLLFVLACCVMGAAAMVGLPMTTGGVSVVAVVLAAWAIALVVTRPRPTPLPIKEATP